MLVFQLRLLTALDTAARWTRWWEEVLASSAPLRESLCQEVVVRLADPKQSADVLPLAEQLLARQELEPHSSLAALGGAVLRAQPLTPLPGDWDQTLAALTDHLPADLAARWRIRRFLRQIERQVNVPASTW